MTDPELKRTLSEMQGKLFELSGINGFDNKKFIRTFVNSEIAKGLDSDFDYTQWTGRKYIFEKMAEDCPEECVIGVTIYDNEALYWTGYLYRYWNFYTGETGRIIYKTADAKIMNTVYLGYYTLDVETVIDSMYYMHGGTGHCAGTFNFNLTETLLLLIKDQWGIIRANGVWKVTQK